MNEEKKYLFHWGREIGKAASILDELRWIIETFDNTPLSKNQIILIERRVAVLEERMKVYRNKIEELKKDE